LRVDDLVAGVLRGASTALLGNEATIVKRFLFLGGHDILRCPAPGLAAPSDPLAIGRTASVRSISFAKYANHNKPVAKLYLLPDRKKFTLFFNAYRSSVSPHGGRGRLFAEVPHNAASATQPEVNGGGAPLRRSNNHAAMHKFGFDVPGPAALQRSEPPGFSQNEIAQHYQH
jgi:hypothetical protein